MKSGLFSRLKDKLKSLNAREKWLFLIGAVIFSFLLADRLILSPMRNYSEELALKTEEGLKTLAYLRNYTLHKEWQKDLFKGKTSDFLNILMRAAEESQLGLLKLKKTENTDRAFLVHFESTGNIQKILDFILKLEKMDFLTFFQKVDIQFLKGSDYHFEGIIQVLY
jgi:hypothetical protein